MQTLTDDVVRAIADLIGCAPSRVRLDAELADLVTDSFALVEVAIGLQEDFGVVFRQEDLRGVRTVGDVVALISSRR